MNENETHRVSKQLHSILKICSNVGFSTLMLVLILILGPIMEGQYFPVVRHMSATFVKSENGKMYFDVVGEKLRACKFIEIRAVVDKSISDPTPPVKAFVQFKETSEGPLTRPVGFQSFGMWEIVPTGDRAILQGSWSCHRLWDTNQSIGEFEVPVELRK